MVVMPDALDNIAVHMVRPNLRDIPRLEMPAGFRIRGMRIEDAPLWTEVQRSAESYLTIGDELFLREFGSDLAAIGERCYLIETEAGYAVGTISAWYDRSEDGNDPGRIHWVAVRPGYQRRGLARAGMSHALSRLAEWHDRALLGTSTGRLGAIRLYLDFGFVPAMTAPRSPEAWALVRSRLDHPALAGIAKDPEERVQQ